MIELTKTFHADEHFTQRAFDAFGQRKQLVLFLCWLFTMWQRN